MPISSWSTTPASNNATPPNGAPEGWPPSAVNDTIRQNMADIRAKWEDAVWFDDGVTKSFVSTTQFKISGQDVTSTFHANRRVRAVGATTGTIFGTISSSSFSTDTTVTVTWDSGTLQNETLTISYSIIGNDNPALSKEQIEAISTSAGKHTVWVPAAAMVPTVSNGCGALTRTETTSGRPDIHGLPFDQTTAEFAQFSIAPPKSWDEGTLTYQAYWTVTSATSGGVAWTLQGVAMSDNDTMDAPYGSQVTVIDTSHATAEDMQITDESTALTVGGSPAEADAIAFRMGRAPANASDTMAADATLLGIRLFLTTNAETDA